MVDLMPFDVSGIIGTTDQGVVVDASLWTGILSGDELHCMIAGKLKGECVLTRSERTSPLPVLLETVGVHSLGCHNLIMMVPAKVRRTLAKV